VIGKQKELWKEKVGLSCDYLVIITQYPDIMLFWNHINCRGTAPSPRFNHVAALYDDKILYIFGGSSKSRTLNDLYSLDFETVSKLSVGPNVSNLYCNTMRMNSSWTI